MKKHDGMQDDLIAVNRASVLVFLCVFGDMDAPFPWVLGGSYAHEILRPASGKVTMFWVLRLASGKQPGGR